MLWIALHLPQLPLQALPWSQPGLDRVLPVAVAEQHALIGANRAACAAGVRAGQSVATALALLPGLIVQPRDAARERACVERLALALAVLTPNLSLAEHGVLLQVQASLRLFGGVRALLRRAQAIARAAGLHARQACAPSASAAWLLASAAGVVQRHSLRAGTCARQLDRVPVAALTTLLPLIPRQIELLEALGLERLAELRALPRAGLQRRFGRALSDALDRAYGDKPDPRDWLQIPERFEACRELLQRADDAAVLVQAVHSLLPALHGWLQMHWHAASVLVLRLRHEHGREPLPDTLLRLELSLPSRDMAQLALLWRERLERHALVAPVYEIALALEASVPHGGTPGELLALPGGQARDHAALLDRLVARLGSERVLRYEPMDDHRPERAQRAVPVVAHAPLAASPAQSAVADVQLMRAASRAGSALDDEKSAFVATTLPRPTWLLEPPQPLGCDALGQPVHEGQTLRLCSRAERIEAGWFDMKLARRDYRVAEGQRDHRLRWIYRERGPGDKAWFLHGWFG